jgi:hypothetical protein
MTKKLSETQADIIWKMQHGWQLASQGFCHIGEPSIIILQRGGIGSGGELRYPSLRTLNALLNAGVIVVAEQVNWFDKVYRLTEAGKKVNQ